jgi:hypothetical protein
VGLKVFSKLSRESTVATLTAFKHVFPMHKETVVTRVNNACVQNHVNIGPSQQHLTFCTYFVL